MGRERKDDILDGVGGLKGGLVWSDGLMVWRGGLLPTDQAMSNFGWLSQSPVKKRALLFPAYPCGSRCAVFERG